MYKSYLPWQIWTQCTQITGPSQTDMKIKVCFRDELKYAPWIKIASENRSSQKERIVFQESIFRCELLVSGRVFRYIISSWTTKTISTSWSNLSRYTERVFCARMVLLYLVRLMNLGESHRGKKRSLSPLLIVSCPERVMRVPKKKRKIMTFTISSSYFPFIWTNNACFFLKKKTSTIWLTFFQVPSCLRILVRAVGEGATLVMRAINTNQESVAELWNRNRNFFGVFFSLKNGGGGSRWLTSTMEFQLWCLGPPILRTKQKKTSVAWDINF